MTDTHDAEEPVLFLLSDGPMDRQPPIPPRLPDFNRLRRLVVWLPVTAIGVLIVLVEGLMASLRLPWRYTLGAHAAMLGLIAVGAHVFSRHIFGVVRRKEEEILRKHEELAALERRFRVLLENSSDGIVLLSADGIFRYASPPTTRLVGYAAEELLGHKAFEFIHPEDQEAVTARFVDALHAPGQSIRVEFRVRHQDGSWRWIEAVLRNLLSDPSIQAVVGNYRDVTLRKQAEEELRRGHDELETLVRERTDDLVQANAVLQATLAERDRAEAALRESRAQFAGILGSAMEAILTIDEDECIVLFNAAAEQMFRVSAAEVIGQSVHRFIPARFRPTHQAGLRDFGRMNLETWWIGVLGGATALRADGEEFPIEAALSQVEVGGRKLYTIILHDITARNQAEMELRSSREQLRALAGRLLTVREDERARIAKEIHDALAQSLAGLKFNLAWVVAKLPAKQAPLVEKLKEISEFADATIRTALRISEDLRPSLLDVFGLVATLEWQAQEFQSRTGIWCECVSSAPDVPLQPEASTTLFRICQEALTNVARHAQATRASIRVSEEAGAVVLTVADDGRGITQQQIADQTSLGLLSMREQALRLGGEVAIVGRPREGTTIKVRIPLRQAVSETAKVGQPQSVPRKTAPDAGCS